MQALFLHLLVKVCLHKLLTTADTSDDEPL